MDVGEHSHEGHTWDVPYPHGGGCGLAVRTHVATISTEGDVPHSHFRIRFGMIRFDTVKYKRDFLCLVSAGYREHRLTEGTEERRVHRSRLLLHLLVNGYSTIVYDRGVVVLRYDLPCDVIE
jgi:hypothetical protein